jgi:hypothetical protein
MCLSKILPFMVLKLKHELKTRKHPFFILQVNGTSPLKTLSQVEVYFPSPYLLTPLEELLHYNFKQIYIMLYSDHVAMCSQVPKSQKNLLPCQTFLST